MSRMFRAAFMTMALLAAPHAWANDQTAKDHATGTHAASPHATPAQARALLTKAVEKLRTDGAKQAFAAFNQNPGAFIHGDLYVFVFDLKGRYLASGANPALVGSDANEMKDAEGKPLVQDMIKLAGGDGKGEVDYVWLNRASNKIEEKHSLIQRVDKYIVGVGYYVIDAQDQAAMEAAGQQVFNHCVACHFLEPGKQGFGPDLHGVVGRPAASLPNFNYSDGLKTSGIVWTENSLRQWMAGNDKMVPGTRMRHVAITDKVEQDYLIAFLKTLK